MALRSLRMLLGAGLLMVMSVGCAHRGPEPFIDGPTSVTPKNGQPPPCFSGPLADCVVQGLERSDVERLSSRWRFAFHPDLNNRVCRPDVEAQRRVLDAVRRLADDQNLEDLSQMMLVLLSDCDSVAFCDWGLAIAADAAEAPMVRDLYLEAIRRACSELIPAENLDRAGSDLGRIPSAEHPWVTSSSQQRCSDIEFPTDPWEDLEASHLAGCLDLGEWLQRHRGARQGVALALQRCVEQHEIRYREADCLRELAGLDRRLAVNWLRSEERRGFGRSSTINRYARVLQRFPNEGQLEGRLTDLGLISEGAEPQVVSGFSPVLGAEILESYGRLARFSPACAERYCEHAPLMYRLINTAAGELDDLVIEERWPALERIDLGSGPRAVSTTVGAIPVTFHLSESDGDETFDRQQYDQLRSGFEDALTEPHQLRVYSDGKVYSLSVRNLGRWFDLETVLGGLNTILADRGSDLRMVTLAPHCIPCAQVLTGPGEGLIEAAFEGLIEVVDPFHELWPLPDFDASRLMGSTSK